MPGKRTAKTTRAIAFSLHEGSLPEVLNLIQFRLKRAENNVEVMLTPLDGTLYAESFTTVRAQKRAVGILRGFVQVEKESIQLLTTEEVNEIFNRYRREEEQRHNLFPI